MAKKILIVDDNPDAVEFSEAVLLEIGGLSVITANDGESGLKEARTQKPDLIILDVMMPEKDGFSVFHDLRKDEETRDIPVIMLTGVSEETGIKFTPGDIGEYVGKEPEAFMDKPADPVALQRKVKRILGI
jgi:CheY-like chemotaxis protein